MRHKLPLDDKMLGFITKKSRINPRRDQSLSELFLCRFLEDWSGLSFRRVNLSKVSKGFNVDVFCFYLVCDNPSFPFFIQTFHVKSIHFRSPLSNNMKLVSLWERAYNDSNRRGRDLILFVRGNSSGVGFYRVLMPDKYVKLFNKHGNFVSSTTRKPLYSSCGFLLTGLGGLISYADLFSFSR